MRGTILVVDDEPKIVKQARDYFFRRLTRQRGWHLNPLV